MAKSYRQYLLEDILAVKYGGDEKENEMLAHDLARLAQGKGGISVVNGFAVGNILLIIRDLTAPAVKKLILLDSVSRKHFEIESLDEYLPPVRAQKS